MNLTRCNNGHFYDMDKFDSCPHCQNAGAAQDHTTPLNNVGNTGMSSPFEGGSGDVTMPIGSVPNEGFTPVMDTGRATAPVNNTPAHRVADETPTEPLNTNDMPRYDRQIQPEKPGADTPSQNAPSLSELVEQSQTFSSDPSEKTIGIYSSLNNADGTQENVIEPVVGWLVCVKGTSFGASFTLKSGKNFIGRDKNMDVSIPGDKSVSRQCHAIILYDPKSKMFLVQPGTSRELFYLNDKVVLGVEEVASNDILTIGKTDLMFIPCCSDRFSWEDQIKKNKASEESDA